MRILLADDHTLFRSSLRSLVEARGLEVVGEASDGRQAVELATQLQPDLVLMDLSMPVLNGIEATRQLTATMPHLKVVILTASMEDEDLFDALRAGAHGYLPKNLEADSFFDLLDRALAGEPVLSPQLSRRVLDAFSKRETASQPVAEPDSLTDRERQVLELMVDGITSNRQIAKRLEVTENTVKFHVRHILDKLHLHNRAQAVSHALRHGVVVLGGKK
ncbi:MAG TPA: response regulator transcription factor [Thermoanaerobaculia bacterium]|jgi:DNA-binding NarL/FixJ family response regulator|nr:response regulator transcription factor [Thermoanaerobaculia bacterium]